jgi:hypothetical protein
MQTRPKSIPVVPLLSIILVPLLLCIFYIVYKCDEGYYIRSTREGRLVESLTFIFLLLCGIFAIYMSKKAIQNKKFCFIFGRLCILFSLEELNWGQGLMGIKTPEFFYKYSDQGNINAHNLLQKTFHFKTKHVAGWVLFFYGVCLPLICLRKNIRASLAKKHIVIPPLILSHSFFIAALMMIDFPTGQEEELGELFFSICFLLFIIQEYVKQRTQVKAPYAR